MLKYLIFAIIILQLFIIILLLVIEVSCWVDVRLIQVIIIILVIRWYIQKGIWFGKSNNTMVTVKYGSSINMRPNNYGNNGVNSVYGKII